MNRETHANTARKLLTNALNEIAEQSAHPLDDDAFVFRLITDRLSDAEQHQLDAHLAECEICAEAVQDMLDEAAAGTVPPAPTNATSDVAPPLSQVDPADIRRQTTVRQQRQQQSWSSPMRLLIIAVCLLALIPLGKLLIPSPGGIGSDFATLSTLVDLGLSAGQGSKSLGGTAAERQERVERAREALQAQPDQLNLKLNLARWLLVTDKPDEALQLLREANTTQPGDPVILNAIGMAEHLQANFEIAIDYFDQAARQQQMLVPASLNKAESLMQLKRPDEAVELLRNLQSNSSLNEDDRRRLDQALSRFEKAR
ncbi:MAG: hypothetical protein KDA85_02655 [Planctomycetaceae bacterium]|nr:hypothetical protein [Planctomycetaceae bacterium]